MTLATEVSALPWTPIREQPHAGLNKQREISGIFSGRC